MSEKLNLFRLIGILLLLNACNGNSASDEKSVPATPVNAIVEPKNAPSAFQHKCAVCHGDNGAAGIGNAANLQVSKLDSASIVNVITRGKGSMPSFAGQLTDQQIAETVKYVRSLQK